MTHIKKIYFFWLLFFSAYLLTSSCNFTPSSNREKSNSQSVPPQISQSVDSGLYRLAGGSLLKIIPGTSVGSLQLKMEWERAPVFQYFGKPDSTDAAMCKNWAMWYWTDQQEISKELDIYAACDPDMDMKKSIKMIRIKGASFITISGVTDSTGLTTLKTRLSDISNLGVFKNQMGNKITLWDDIPAGIAFEFSDTSSVFAVIIHEPGKPVTDIYLPFYQATAPEVHPTIQPNSTYKK